MSAAEISLFLDRAVTFPNQTFTILRTDELKAPDQEVIANFLARHARSGAGLHLHCVQLSDTILYAPPGVEVRSWDQSTIGDDNTHLAWLRKHVISRSKNIIKLVNGTCGSGKTTLIRNEMNKLEADKASIYIHEDFSLSTATKALRTKFQREKFHRRAIHFCLSASTDDDLKKDLLLSINYFFNSFLLLGTIYDPSSGGCFHSGLHSYEMFVEMSCVGDEESCQQWLRRFIPVLGCCGVTIKPPPEYIVDEATRRVCTYLRGKLPKTSFSSFNHINSYSVTRFTSL